MERLNKHLFYAVVELLVDITYCFLSAMKCCFRRFFVGFIDVHLYRVECIVFNVSWRIYFTISIAYIFCC